MGERKNMAEEEKKKSKKQARKIHDYYEIKEYKLERKRKKCPKCGSGVFLGEHSDRSSCGKCGYTEWKKK